ncbi:MAG: DegT/DnrJ/EryC1/StrS family aminotransferase [bacterium]
MTDKIQVAKPIVGDREVDAVEEVIRSGHYVSGPNVEQFENRFADYIGTEEAVGLNTGTAALHLALAICGIGPGDEVIVPPLTFFSTVTSVLHQNAVPVFADIDPDSYCLDPDSVEQQITPRTKAVIPVHLYGQSADMDAFVELADSHDLVLIEDCAQAHGTRYRGQTVGSIGDFGAFSFYATKHMTTGEGGALTTNNPEWAEKARQLRSHGMTDRDHHDYLGYNYRINEIAAAMGLEQLNRLEELNEQRIENSLYLIEQLEQLDRDWFETPTLYDHIRHTFFWCHLQIDEQELGMDTNELRLILEERGVETRHRYQEPLYKQKILTKKSAYPEKFPFDSEYYPEPIDYDDVHFPHVENIAGTMIGLPNRPDLEQDQLDRIVEVMAQI